MTSRKALDHRVRMVRPVRQRRDSRRTVPSHQVCNFILGEADAKNALSREIGVRAVEILFGVRNAADNRQIACSHRILSTGESWRVDGPNHQSSR